MAIYGTRRVSVQVTAIAGEGDEIDHRDSLDEDQTAPFGRGSEKRITRARIRRTAVLVIFPAN